MQHFPTIFSAVPFPHQGGHVKHLTEQQALFVAEYLKDRNRYRAHEVAYGNRDPGNTGKVFRNKKVKAAIARISKRMQREAKANALDVLKELMKLAFSDISDYVEVYQEKDPKTGKLRTVFSVKPEDEWSDTSACIQEIAWKKGQVSVKLYDKKAALDSIAKHLGMYLDKIEHSGKITADTIVQVMTGITRQPTDPVPELPDKYDPENDPCLQ